MNPKCYFRKAIHLADPNQWLDATINWEALKYSQDYIVDRCRVLPNQRFSKKEVEMIGEAFKI